MKKKLLSIIACLTVLLSCACSEANGKMPLALPLELYSESEVTVDFSQMDSKFEFVTLFYQDIFFNRNLLNSVNREDLRAVCRMVYENLLQGRKSQIVVKNFLDGQDLVIAIGQLPGTNDNLLITTNYNSAENSIITDPEDLANSWALLYYIDSGKLVYYKKINEERQTAQQKLQQNLSDLKRNPQPLTYMMIVENYFEMGEIEKGIKYLNSNRNKAIKLSKKTSAPGNINDVITCLEEEGKVFLELK